MIRFVGSVVIVLLGAVTWAEDKNTPPLSEGAKKSLAQLQGEWIAKEFGRFGKKIDVKDEKMILEIKNTKWIFTGKEKGEFVALDPKAELKSFDVKSTEEGRKGAVDEAIYKIDGNTLTVCLYQGKDKKRPTAFETSTETPDTILMVFEKINKKLDAHKP